MDVCWISEYLQDDVVSDCIIQFAHWEAWYVALCNLQGINGGLLLSCQEVLPSYFGIYCELFFL